MESKIVLITGSSRGIGQAIARGFSDKGYKIVLNCKKNSDIMEKLKVDLLKTNNNVISFVCDVSDYEQVKNMINKINLAWGNVDILINNAGISHVGLFSKMEEQDWNNIIDVNLKSVINCSRAVISSMISNKSGIIINISSIWGEVGASCEVIYSATKAGVDGFTKALAKEVGPCGIRINSMSCGIIDTEMNNNLTEQEKADFTNNIPLCKMGSVEDIANICLFLASDSSKYITGQVIRADGGFL